MSLQDFDPTFGPARERIDAQELAELQAAGVVVRDARRERPLFFDGRFLAAKDLVRDQAHTLFRLGDLGRALGAGVVEGLEVIWQRGSSSLTITAGHGVTPSGEQVVLRPDDVGDGLEVGLVDIPRIQLLGRTLELSKLPHPPAHALSGAFLLVLRPVEFTANPIDAYPTTIDGLRSSSDGDIVEATAVSLMPDPVPLVAADLRGDVGRAELARARFLLGAGANVPPQVLPIAVVYLENGQVRWVDPHLARGAAGRAPADEPVFGAGARSSSEEWLAQYSAQLEDVALPAGSTLAAADWFSALPPAGPLPAAALDAKSFTQTWFPAEIDTEVALVPADELPALVEEALVLPGIDLSADAEALSSTSVLVVVPVPRARIGTLRARLAAGERAADVPQPEGRLAAWDPGRRVALSRIRGRLALRDPRDRLLALGLRLRTVATYRDLPDIAAPPDVQRIWEEELSRHEVLWYVRRRNVERRLELYGERLELSGTDSDAEDALEGAVGGAGVAAPWRRLKERLSARSKALLYARAQKSPALLEHPLLLRNLVAELAARADALVDGQLLDAVEVEAKLDLLASPRLGEGLARLTRVSEKLRTTEFTEATLPLADLVRLDALAGRLDDEHASELAERIVTGVLPASQEERPRRLALLIQTFERGGSVLSRLDRLGVRLRPGTLSANEINGRESLALLGSALERSSSRLFLGAVTAAIAPASGENENTRRARIRRWSKELKEDPEAGRGLEEAGRREGVLLAREASHVLGDVEVALAVDRQVRALPAERRARFLGELRAAVRAGAGTGAVTELVTRRGGNP